MRKDLDTFLLAFYRYMSSKKVSGIFECTMCKYETVWKSNYTKHLLTLKHKNAKNANENANKSIEKNLFCNCGKKYRHESSFSRHRKLCNFLDDKKIIEDGPTENIIIKKEEIDYATIIGELKNIIIDQQKQIGEMIPKIGNNNNNIKQKFNINVFLDEKCKDAISIDKFIDNLKVTLEDLFITKNKGITEGITNIITKNMNELSLYERPLHCTDTKRDTVYIKLGGENGTNGHWKKDNKKENLKKAIKNASYVQGKNLNLYTDKNPDWMAKDDTQTEYITMVRNCTDDIEKDNRVDKVAKKVCNNVYYNGE